EETQIAGFLADAPKFDGVLCLPGTHSKWAHISAQEVVSFRTFMTGDLYAALAKHSILAATVLGAEGADEEAFIAAVAEMLSKPETLGSALFSIRAETLLNDQGAQTGAARLSGLLIGAELAASRPYWLGQDVVLIGEEALSERYLLALGAQGVVARVAKACDMTLAGLAAARAAMARTPA
ncbi:MAG: 2-dehydro-3-deoxygalactonokinase, partial [Pseudomonadota bacterium]